MESKNIEFSAPKVAVKPLITPDIVLVMGATGCVGNVVLRQGLDLYPNTEFRIFSRDSTKAQHLFPNVKFCKGDVRVKETIEKACDGFTENSLIMDSVTDINLSAKVPQSCIDINVDGMKNTLEVVKKFGATFHKVHTCAGLHIPKEGDIVEQREIFPIDEEEINYLPYYRAKRTATLLMKNAIKAGYPLMMTYLPAVYGPFCEYYSFPDVALTDILNKRSQFYVKDVGSSAIDVRDIAKVHWIGYNYKIYDDFLLKGIDVSLKDFADVVTDLTGLKIKSRAISQKNFMRLAHFFNFLDKLHLMPKGYLLSLSVAKILLANNQYSHEKVKRIMNFEARDFKDTVDDHIQYLVHNKPVKYKTEKREISVW